MKVKKIQNKAFTLGWKKDIPYGLSLKISYSDLSRSQVHSGFLKQINSSEQTYRKNLNLELNANLNSALVQHWAFEAIDKGKKLNEWLYYEKAEELALKSATQYWKSYLAWTAYNQAKEGLKTYKRLVRQIHRKKRYGFLKPGERPQILAEYENIKQETDKQKQNYENEKKALLLFIKRDPDLHDIQFKKEKLKPLPRFPKIKIENTRILKIKKMKIREQELQLKISRMELFPSLELSGKGGFIPGAASPNQLSFSSKQSFYEFGLSVHWIFFSKSFYEKVNQKKYELEESQIDREILKQELKNKLSSLEKEIMISHKNAERAKKSNKYQKRAFRELKNSFDQGRVDIFELISTESKLRESEVRKKTALSEYSLLVLQNLALRDQLVEDYLKP